MTWLLWVVGAVGLLLLHWYMVAGACEIVRDEEHEKFQRGYDHWSKVERAHIVAWLRSRATIGATHSLQDLAEAIERGDDWTTTGKWSVHPAGEDRDE